MRITFVRHGESRANADGLWQGQGSAPLTDRGREQAKAVAERLGRRPPPDLVISSDLDRAVETADAIGGPRIVDARWREMDLGAWEGRTAEEVRAEGDDVLARLRAGDLDVPFGGHGETLRAFGARVDEALDELLARDLERVVVVAHGGVIDMVLRRSLPWRPGRRSAVIAANASLTELERTSWGLRLLRFNDAGHLGVDPPGDHRLASLPLVTLIRHGQTDANVEGRWQGRSDWGLNDTGRAQAEALAAWFGRRPRVASSPLGRALETARALAIDEPEVHEDLAELGFGLWEGLTVAEIAERWPEAWETIYRRREDEPRGFTGETWSELGTRVDRAVEDLVARLGDPIAVSHGGAIRAFVARRLGLDWQAAGRIAGLDNTALARVALAPEGAVLVDYNVAPHLDP